MVYKRVEANNKTPKSMAEIIADNHYVKAFFNDLIKKGLENNGAKPRTKTEKGTFQLLLDKLSGYDEKEQRERKMAVFLFLKSFRIRDPWVWSIDWFKCGDSMEVTLNDVNQMPTDEGTRYVKVLEENLNDSGKIERLTSPVFLRLAVQAVKEVHEDTPGNELPSPKRIEEAIRTALQPPLPEKKAPVSA